MHSACVLWEYTHTENVFWPTSDSAQGSVRSQSRRRLYADKAAATGAETIAMHARGLLLHTV